MIKLSTSRIVIQINLNKQKKEQFRIFSVSNTLRVNEIQLLFKLDLLPWENYCLSHNKYMNKADYHGGITASGAFHLAMFQYVRRQLPVILFQNTQHKNVKIFEFQYCTRNHPH